MSDRRKLTKSECGRLGGLQNAHNLGAEGRVELARRGGAAVVEKYGAVHMTRLAYQKAGRLPAKKVRA